MLEKVVKYGLHWTELNNFKARLVENLVKRYIEKVLIPDLIKQGWSQVIFDPMVWELEKEFFVDNGLYPTKGFLKAVKKLGGLLKNVPDGWLIKLRRTELTKRLIEALKEFGLENYACWEFPPRPRFTRSEHDDNEQLAIVEGEIEIVEVKTGKAIIPAHQMISYRKVLHEGYTLHFFHVNIISFEENRFEIEEKLVTTPEELEIIQKKERKRSSIHKT